MSIILNRTIRRCPCIVVLALTMIGGGTTPAGAQPEVADVTQAGDVTAAATRAVAPAATADGIGGTPATTDTTAGASTEEAHWTPQPSLWRDLFGRAADDLRRFPSMGTAELLAIGGIAAAGVRPADAYVSRSIAGVMSLHEPLEPGAVLGSTPFQMAGSLATYGIARWTGKSRIAAVGADLFRAQLVAEALTVGMKQSFRRGRPEGSGFAFPSGHTTVSFASATVLHRHFGWRLGLPAYGIAGYVALSRVQMKRHYLSDVAFGAALGLAAGRTVTLGSTRRVELAPLVTPGGGGMQISWLGR